MLLRKRDFKIYGVRLLDFTADFEGIIILFDTWLLCFPGVIVNKLFILSPLRYPRLAALPSLQNAHVVGNQEITINDTI